MSKKIIVDVDKRQTRVAMLEDGRLAEVLYEQEEEERVVGNIYLGRVSDVVPGLDAAFVDCGIEKNVFLKDQAARHRYHQYSAPVSR